MENKYLNKTGLERLWFHILNKLSEKVSKDGNKVLSDVNYSFEDKEKLDGISTKAVNFEPTNTTGDEIGVLTINETEYTLYANQDTDTHYEATLGTSVSATTSSFDSSEINNPFLKLIENGQVKGAVQLIGGDNITITRDADGKIIISATNSVDSIQIGNILAQESSTGGWAFVAV